MTGIVDEIVEIHTVIAKDYLPRLKAAIAEVEQGSHDALAVAKDVVRTIEAVVNGTVTNAAPAPQVQAQAPVLTASVQELAAQQSEAVEPEAVVAKGVEAGAEAGEAFAEAVAPAHKRTSRAKHD
jgi:methyl-accepting chemotaxis protein